MLSFIHAADIHLDSPLQGLSSYEGAPVDKIRGATRRAFEKLIDFALSQQVHFLLLAGDLYDGDWRDYNTGLFFISQVARLKKADIPVYMVSGNHDAASRITRSLRLPDNVHAFPTHQPDTKWFKDERTPEGYRIAIHGQSFAHQKVTEDLSRNYPPPVAGYLNIGLLHTSADGREGHATYAPCSPTYLKNKGYDYWALGHIHKREIVSQDPWIIFPGNLQGRHILESGPKGATLVTVKGGHIQDVNHHTLDVVRWELIEIDLTLAQSTDELLDLTRQALEAKLEEQEAGKLLAARLIFTGNTDLHPTLASRPEHWTAEIRALGLQIDAEELWIEKVLFKTSPVSTSSSSSTGEDVTSYITEVIKQLIDDDKALEELGRKFLDPLNNTIPRNCLSENNAIHPGDVEFMRSALKDAEALLTARLIDSYQGRSKK